MNTRNIFTKLSIAIALVALAATGAVWQIRSVHAIPPPDPDRSFGMVGLTHGQTMRLNVVNLSPPDPNRQLPPDPCRVLLSFRNAVGEPFTNNDGQPIRRTVELLSQEKVVGWVQGRMEFGPRALGNRSILGDPRSPRMQSMINLKVKFRESFRPFAPAVRRERLSEYFELEADSPYMLLVAPVKPSLCRAMPESARGLDRLH